MRKLIIIGNGFDLHHNMKTSYLDYRKFLIDSGFNTIISSFEKREEEFDINKLWNSIESILGLVEYEMAYTFLTEYSDKNWSEKNNHDFQYEIQTMMEYWPGIKEKLFLWIQKIEYTIPDKNLKDLIDNNAVYLSFNYTNTLEQLYQIRKENILYIHGDASASRDLILGHRNESYYPEWNGDDPDCDIRLKEAGELMEKHRLETYKDIEHMIMENISFFNSIKNINEIYVIGLSYNDVDLLYLEKIHDLNPSLDWNFNWYSEEDFKKIDNFTEKTGIKNYKKINISKL